MPRITIEYLKAAANSRQYPDSDLPEFAVIGRSNVGKSSLINTLGGRSLAQTSKTPGKTRLLHFYLISGILILTDLPGYGYAAVPQVERNRWDTLASQYLQTRRQLRDVVLLIDARHGLMPLDIRMLEWMQMQRLSFLVVATKIDKLPRSRQGGLVDSLRSQLSRFSSNPAPVIVIPFSSKTGQGKIELVKTLFNRLKDDQNIV